MRVARHLLYAVAALISVSLIALKDPSLSVAMETIEAEQGAAMACSSDHLERPCDPGIRVAGVMQDGRVTAR